MANIHGPVFALGRLRSVAKDKAVNTLAKVNIQQNTFPLDLPSQGPQLIAIEKIKRPLGYAIPGSISLSATLRYGQVRVQGFGEGPEQLAIAKAISEATERAVQKHFALQTGLAESSNGWACHTSPSLATQSAILELIERDVALSNWESNGPFYELPTSLWPAEITAWNSARSENQEFSHLRILLSSNQNGACVSALLFNNKLNFVSGHASSLELNNAILSATAECMRAAHAALRLENFSEVTALHLQDFSSPTSPGAHSLAYAYSVPLPSCVQILNADEPQVLKIWKNHVTTFSELKLSGMQTQLYQVGDLYVARVRSDQLRPIYWGENRNYNNFINISPHFVG
ncbi:MAG: YcaO-like family protein [Pseudobdellovibrionaceae bacterium]